MPAVQADRPQDSAQCGRGECAEQGNAAAAPTSTTLASRHNLSNPYSSHRPAYTLGLVYNSENNCSPGPLVQAAGGTFAAFLAIPTGPFAPLAAAAMTPATTLMSERIAREWCRKTRMVDESVQATSGLSPEDLGDVLTGDPEMIALTQRVLDAAASSGNEKKLRGLGALLGRAAANPGDRLDETQVLVAALADLEGPHLLVLDILTQQPPVEWAGWAPSQVRERVSMGPEFVLACLNALTRHGLAAPVSGTGLAGGEEQGFKITLLGQAIAAAMSSLGSRPTAG